MMSLRYARSQEDKAAIETLVKEAETNGWSDPEIDTAAMLLSNTFVNWDNSVPPPPEEEDEDDVDPGQNQAEIKRLKKTKKLVKDFRSFLGHKNKHNLQSCPMLRRSNNYAKRNFFSRKKVSGGMFVWQKDQIPRSIFHLSTAYCKNDKQLSIHVKGVAKLLFKNLRGY